MTAKLQLEQEEVEEFAEGCRRLLGLVTHVYQGTSKVVQEDEAALESIWVEMRQLAQKQAVNPKRPLSRAQAL